MPETQGHLGGSRFTSTRTPCGPIRELAPAHFNLGEIDAGSGRINEAIDHYREALRIDPDFALAHYFLGIALLAKGRLDEVFEDYPADVESLNQFRGPALDEAIAYYWQAYST